MSEPVPDRQFAGLEAALKGLAPTPARLDRDRLFFRAGQASAQRRYWLWPSAAAVLAVAAGTLGLTLALRPAPAPVERVVTRTVPAPAPQRSPAPLPPRQARPAPAPAVRPSREETVAGDWQLGGYLRQRNEVLRWGVDALPGPRPVAAPSPPPVPTLRHDLSGRLADWSFLKWGGSL